MCHVSSALPGDCQIARDECPDLCATSGLSPWKVAEASPVTGAYARIGNGCAAGSCDGQLGTSGAFAALKGEAAAFVDFVVAPAPGRIFDYANGFVDGAVSLGTGVGHFIGQMDRRYGPSSSVEGANTRAEDAGINRGLSALVNDGHTRRTLEQAVWGKATDMSTYSPYNLGHAAGRLFSADFYSPLGFVGTYGDVLNGAQQGRTSAEEMLRSVIYGSEAGGN